MSMRRRLIPALLLLTGFTISACTAILVPDQGDDNVERCNNSDECSKIADNRYVAQCVHGEGQPESSPKVCASDFEIVRCGGMAQGGDHVLSKTYNEAQAVQALYGQCSMENRGKRGCRPRAGGECDPGLSVSQFSDICDDPDDPIPAISPTDVGNIAIAGQDVMDQFCRWYFCDETFVCDNTGAQPTCRRCSGKDPTNYPNGACGEIYLQGERSSFYTDLDDANCNGDRPSAEAVFGPAPTFEDN